MKNLQTRRSRGNQKSDRIDVDTIQRRLETATNKKWKHFILEYFVSEDGQLYNEHTKRVQHPVIVNGRKQYSLCFKGKRKTFLASRLVGYCFGNGVDVEMLLDSDAWVAHHIDFTKNNDHYINITYLDKDTHIKLHSEILSGKLNREDVNTLDKLTTYLISKSRNNGILNDLDFDIDDNVWIDRTEIFPDDEYRDFLQWCEDEGYNEQLLSSTIVYALVSDKAS